MSKFLEESDKGSLEFEGYREICTVKSGWSCPQWLGEDEGLQVTLPPFGWARMHNVSQGLEGPSGDCLPNGVKGKALLGSCNRRGGEEGDLEWMRN